MTLPNTPEARVVSVDAGGRRRVHFEGLLRDAKAWVENNFPRVHIEPGGNAEPKADVHVESGSTTVTYMGSDSGGDNGWHSVDAQGNVAQPDEEATPIHDDLAGRTLPPTEAQVQ